MNYFDIFYYFTRYYLKRTILCMKQCTKKRLNAAGTRGEARWLSFMCCQGMGRPARIEECTLPVPRRTLFCFVVLFGRGNDARYNYINTHQRLRRINTIANNKNINIASIVDSIRSAFLLLGIFFYNTIACCFYSTRLTFSIQTDDVIESRGSTTWS